MHKIAMAYAFYVYYFKNATIVVYAGLRVNSLWGRCSHICTQTDFLAKVTFKNQAHTMWLMHAWFIYSKTGDRIDICQCAPGFKSLLNLILANG